jgi:hypothetical protein
VKGLEHEETFSASRLPKLCGARNIATPGVKKECERRERHHPGNAPTKDKPSPRKIGFIYFIEWHFLILKIGYKKYRQHKLSK